MNVEVTPLPGIGVRQDFSTRAGRRVGVITYRDGRSELLVYRLDDPDACSASMPLTGEEAGTLASLLGAPRLVEHIAAQHRDLTGIETHQIAVVPGSRVRRGAPSATPRCAPAPARPIVAVIRGGVVHPSPRPDFPLVGRRPGGRRRHRGGPRGGGPHRWSRASRWTAHSTGGRADRAGRGPVRPERARPPRLADRASRRSRSTCWVGWPSARAGWCRWAASRSSPSSAAEIGVVLLLLLLGLEYSAERADRPGCGGPGWPG